MVRILGNERLLWFAAMAAVLACIVMLARQPGHHIGSALEVFRGQCKGDEECAQKLEAQRKDSLDKSIEYMAKQAIARQDALRGQQPK